MIQEGRGDKGLGCWKNNQEVMSVRLLSNERLEEWRIVLRGLNYFGEAVALNTEIGDDGVEREEGILNMCEARGNEERVSM